MFAINKICNSYLRESKTVIFSHPCCLLSNVCVRVYVCAKGGGASNTCRAGLNHGYIHVCNSIVTYPWLN